MCFAMNTLMMCFMLATLVMQLYQQDYCYGLDFELVGDRANGYKKYMLMLNIGLGISGSDMVSGYSWSECSGYFENNLG
jgi:hypothetical protein